jgi:hypothetical protein
VKGEEFLEQLSFSRRTLLQGVNPLILSPVKGSTYPFVCSELGFVRMTK